MDARADAGGVPDIDFAELHIGFGESDAFDYAHGGVGFEEQVERGGCEIPHRRRQGKLCWKSWERKRIRRKENRQRKERGHGMPCPTGKCRWDYVPSCQEAR